MGKRLVSFAAVVLLLSAPLISACASAGGQKPDVVAAQTTGTVLEAATLLQNEVNRLTAARTLPLPVAEQMTGYVRVVHEKAGQLIPLLEAYHAATTPLEKQSKAAMVQAMLTQLSGPLGQLLGVNVPQGLVGSISKLIAQVLSAVATVQTQLAAGLGGGDPPLSAYEQRLLRQAPAYR